MIRERANRLAKFISSCMTTALAAFAALACFSCSNFEEGAFLKKYGDIASVTSIYPSRGLISEGGRLYTDDTDELVIDYYVDNPGHDEFECSLSVPGVTDLVAEGITVTSDNINRITVTYPQTFLASRNVDTGGTGDVSPYVSIVRKSDNYAQCYDNRALYCNTRPPAASALSQLYSDTTVDPPINERLVVCFSVATIPTDVYLLRVVDKRSGTVHSYDVSGGTIADQTSNGWDLTSTVPGTLEPTYDDGPAFTPTGPAYYIATDVQNLKSRTPFDIELTFYDRGGLSSAATVSSHARKLAAPTCNVSSGFETNTFAQPYIDFIIYAPSNCADATLHFAIEDESGNPVADINGNVSTVTGAASFRFYPKINGYANRYTITEAYATKAGWIDSDDAASTFGTGGNVNVNGETLSALTYSLTSGSSYPQETELVITSPEGADITWTHIGHAVETDPSPVRFTFEAAGNYIFGAQPIKDYYTSPAIENTTYDITATIVYVSRYGHGPGDTPAGDGTKDYPFNNFADAMNLLGTAGSATNPANTIYVLDDMTSIDGLSDFSNGYYNIVGCKGKTPGSPVNLGVNGGGTVLSVNGSATVTLRAITIADHTYADSGVVNVNVTGGIFILKDHVKITGNMDSTGKAHNIQLGSGQKINVDADGLAGTKVGVSVNSSDIPTVGTPTVFTTGYATSASAADLPYAHFASDSGYAAILSEATATLGEAAFAVGGGSIDIGEIYSVSFKEDAASSVGSLHVYKAIATSSSGTTDITSEITSWSMKLYCLNSYTGTTFDTNEADLFGFDEATYVLKINAVYGGNTYSSEIEIKHLASEFSTNAATLYSASADMTNNIHAKVENVAGGIKFTISRPHETWYEPSAGGGFGVITIYRQEVDGATSLRCEYSPDPSATTAEVFWPLCDTGARYVYSVQIEPINPRSYREYIRHEMLSITPDDGGGEENIVYSSGTLSATASFVAEKPKVVIANPPTIVTPDPRVESYQMEVHYNAGEDWGQSDTEWMTYYICAPTSLVHIDPYDGTGTDFRTMLASFGHDRFFIQVKFVFTLSSCPGQKWAHKVVDSNYVVVGPAGSAAIPADFKKITAGSFTRKATSTATTAYTVTLTKDFYMCEHEVTQKEWFEVMGVKQEDMYATDKGWGDNYPVYYVNWYHAIAYCNKKSAAEGLTPCYTVSSVSDWGTLDFASIPTSGDSTWNAASYDPDANGYRLPTEAEWEYAALGDYKDDPNWNGYGNSSNSSAVVFAGYNGSNSIDAYAWHDGNASNKTHVVKDKDPNSYSLYDMSGNVSEWCWDWYGSYDSADVSDPSGASFGSYRISRGGSWCSDADSCSVAYRNNDSPNYRYDSLGFRVVRNAP